MSYPLAHPGVRGGPRGLGGFGHPGDRRVGVGVAPLLVGTAAELVEGLDQVAVPEPVVETVGSADVGGHAAWREHQHLVAEPEAVELVGHHDHGVIVVGQFAEEPHQRAFETGVEPRGRLVEQEQRGSGEELGRDVDPLAFAARQFADPIRGSVGDAQLVEDGIDPLGSLVGVDVVREPQPSRVVEGRSDGQPVVEQVGLGNEPDPARELGEVGVQVAPLVEDVAPLECA